MSALILAAMIALFVLIPASIVAHRVATAPPEETHTPAGCRHCADLLQVDPPAHIPGQRTGGES
ncbi:hypothetical protein [Streptomyces sp. ITFR-6]|uniref:hypothetical protein n=1 Tax=Streptomyces sp. ITFR-6 TaxID=3075197 RepID=UPI00288A65E6|nr:hypothetical protein [Streptomyces sp. ITFR-6]WNI31450.1 hypothetical protein RLT59_23670 [Streptomyces sp. ITFR-6]